MFSSPEYICGREGGVNSLWGANANIPMAAVLMFHAVLK